MSRHRYGVRSSLAGALQSIERSAAILGGMALFIGVFGLLTFKPDGALSTASALGYTFLVFVMMASAVLLVVSGCTNQSPRQALLHICKNFFNG